MADYEEVCFATLTGKVIERVTLTDDSIEFETSDQEVYCLMHDQDCCEDVYIEDIIGGEIEDIAGYEIIEAYEATSRDKLPVDDGDESWTWTFFIIRTMDSSLTIRFYGSSNGYYSESASLYHVVKRAEPLEPDRGVILELGLGDVIVVKRHDGSKYNIVCETKNAFRAMEASGLGQEEFAKVLYELRRKAYRGPNKD